MSTQDVRVEALLNIRCIVKGYYLCRFEVNVGEVFTVNKKRGEHGNNGVDRPARLSRACFSLNQSFALTSISLRERPFLYEMSGFPV